MQQGTGTNRRLQSMKNNALGHYFEGYIKGACEYYKMIGAAEIDQTPEPFRTTRTNRDGTFTGRFTANAQPDFKGTVKGGRAIVFEAKYTSTDRMKKAAVTEVQAQSLEAHWKLGAVTGVCVGIHDVFAFVPWKIWRNMKELYGRQYMTAEEVKKYEIYFNGHARFLERKAAPGKLFWMNEAEENRTGV